MIVSMRYLRERPNLVQTPDDQGVILPGVVSVRRHTLGRKLLDRGLVLRQMRQPHAAQHVRRLGELDVVIADDLDAVAPRIEKVEKRARQRFDAGVSQRFAYGVLVIDHKAKMTAVVSGLGTALLERKELVAQIDEGRCLALPAKFEVEQADLAPPDRTRW